MPERTDHNEAMRLADALEDEGVSMTALDGLSLKAAALLRRQAERIAELEARVHTCGPTCSKAGCINRRLTAERDQLRAEVERLRADGERLDWIEHQYLEDLVMGLAVDCEHDGQYYVCGDDNKTGYGDSLRDAIDAARTTHKETE